jgi:hypothetical protein
MRSSSRSLRNAVPAAVLGLLLFHSGVAAQFVRGRVLDASTRNGVIGAYVVLVDAAGNRLTGVLTNDLGAFALRFVQPGRYSLRAEMIGRQSVDSRLLDLGPTDSVTVDLTLPYAPISLERIDVSAAKKCEVRPGAGGETYTVWEEARKALSLEAATRAENSFRFNIERFERDLDPRQRQVVSERSRYVSRYTGDPFSTMPAGHFADLGFLDERPDGNYLYGPNAEVLLSDRFLDTHCMYLRRDGDHPGQIALAFEPVPGRRVTDIRGDLWLDEKTAELRSLEFRYTAIPGSMPRGDYGGAATFQHLPGGAWIVHEWLIRAPIVELQQTNILGQSRANEVITGYHTEGAEVLLILDQNGDVVDETPRAVLAGVVWDSIGHGPLPGAVVYLVDTDFSDTTDTAGRFRMTNLPAGNYSVSWRNDVTERRGYRPDPRLVELRRGEVAEADFALTSEAFRNLTVAEAARLDSIIALGKALGYNEWASLLERPAAAGGPGRIDGRVVDHESGQGIEGVTVTIVGTDFTAKTGGDGAFLFRDVPPGEYEVRSEHEAYSPQVNRFTLAGDEFLEVSLRLLRTGAEFRPVQSDAAAAAPPSGAAARIFGRVLSNENGKAVSGVVVSIAGTELRRETDGNGVFAFTDLPAGTVEVRTEHLGFNPLSYRVELEPGRSYDAVLDLTPRAIPLDPLEVSVTVEERSPWLEIQGFYDRKLYGGLNGHFITRSEIEKRDPRILTDLYDDLPGVRSFWIQPGQRTVRFRRATTITLSGGNSGYGCEPDYYIDGQRYRDPLETAAVQATVADFNALPVDQVEAIEAYVGAGIPIQYQGSTNCGVILVWTRRGSR